MKSRRDQQIIGLVAVTPMTATMICKCLDSDLNYIRYRLQILLDNGGVYIVGYDNQSRRHSERLYADKPPGGALIHHLHPNTKIAQVFKIIDAAPDGLTVPKILKSAPKDMSDNTIRRCLVILRKKKLVYIDRWVCLSHSSRYYAVFAAGNFEDCPKP